MKRTLTLALSAVLGGAFITSAFAQDNFPDAPENHWAWEALRNMKAAGLLVGYPDGLFRGGRPASRYELAVAVHATYQHLKNLADGLQSKISALEAKIPQGVDPSQFATKAELQALRDALNQANAAIAGMKGWGDDIAALKRMASTFERELASLGVDVEAMKKGLNDLANRVTALEKRKPAVDIHGSVNLVMLGGYSDDDRFGISKEGRPLGVHRATGDPSGIGHDLNIWHEGDLTLTSTNDEGPKFKATVAMGNTMAQESSSFGFFSREAFHQGSLLTGIPFGDENETDIWFQEFEVWFDTTMFGQDVKVRAGRIGKDTGAYFFRRADTTLDYKNALWDNMQWMFDGADFNLNFGNVGVDIFGGRQSHRFTSDGTELWPMFAGNFLHPFEPGGDSGNNPSRPRGFSSTNGIMVDQHLGVVLNIPIMEKGKINLQYLMLDSDSTTTLSSSPLMQVNRVIVMGGELTLPIGGDINIALGYSQTNMNYNNDSVVDDDNAAFWAKFNWNGGGERWGFGAGYRQIDPQFAAPGYWGRVGIWWNPVDVQGFNVNAWFNLSDRTRLMANAEFLQGRDQNIGTSVGLSEDDEVQSFRINLHHKLNDNWSLMAGGEWVMWDVASRAASSFVGGEPKETWFDLGFKYMFNENSWWSIMWQTSDYDSDGVFGFNPFAFDPLGTRATGGKLTSQLSVRY